MPRGGGRRGGTGHCEGHTSPVVQEPAETIQDEILPNKPRVVYARVDNVVKSTEFVLDLPDFVEYLKIPYNDDDAGPAYIQGDVDGNLEFPYIPLRIIIAPHFNADGIMGKIILTEGPSKCYVDYEASLNISPTYFSMFGFSLKTFVVKDQQQVLVASIEDVKRETRELMAMGKPLMIQSADIVDKAKELGIGTTFRIVLNVQARIFRKLATEHSTVGNCRVGTQNDPPFLKAMQDRDDSDVELVCGDETFPVHGFILKNVSRVFRRMLELPMQEGATRKIVIEDLGSDTVKRMMDYIYHGRINVGSNTQVVDLLYAAEKYEFDLLKTACLERMVTSISDENVTPFLDISVRVNAADEVTKQMVDYCLNRITELRKRDIFEPFFGLIPKFS